jgi:hypothetical protein
MIPLCSDIYNISRLTLFTPSKQFDKSHGAVISIRSSIDKLVIVHADFSVSYYKWSSFPDGEGSPFQLKPEKTKFLPCHSIAKSEIQLRKKSFLPKSPLDINIQSFPQITLMSPKRRTHRSGDIKDVEIDNKSNDKKTRRPSWNFFGAIHRKISGNFMIIFFPDFFNFFRIWMGMNIYKSLYIYNSLIYLCIYEYLCIYRCASDKYCS